MSTISGLVKNKRGDILYGVDVTFVNRDSGDTRSFRSMINGEYTGELDPGAYTYVAIEKGYSPEAQNLVVRSGVDIEKVPMIVLSEGAEPYASPVGSVPVGSVPDGSLDTPVEELFKMLTDESKFPIEAKISKEEAVQAIGLFSVANLMLAGMSRRQVGSESKIDILGVLTLYYGLQDRSVYNRVMIANQDLLWNTIELKLDGLAKDLDRLQSDVEFLQREARRQFNIGVTNNVQANVQFPALFRRYVDLGSNPKISIDLRKQVDNVLIDQTRLEEAYDLLRDLKDVIIQIVRSLSRYGTTATKRVNREWSIFEGKALEVLSIVADMQVTQDIDLQNPWRTLASIIDVNPEMVIPYIALSKHGARLLRYAMLIYQKTEDDLANITPDHLVNLFQPQGDAKNWWTTRIREEAGLLKRYPLANWG